METQEHENENKNEKNPLYQLFKSLNEQIMSAQFGAVGQSAIQARKDIQELVSLARNGNRANRKLIMRAARAMKILDDNRVDFSFKDSVVDLVEKMIANMHDLAVHSKKLDEHREKMIREM
jgi:hypothetical protein